ncbi:MAG: helix-turn-helix domain-containing protein [bacterium]
MENKKPKRKLLSQFKAQLVLEYLKGAKSQVEICRENTLSPSLFAKWLRQFHQNVFRIFDDPRNSNIQAEQLAKLERIIGKQTIEIDFLKEARKRFNL